MLEAQQAAEKAVKAVLVARKIPFPKTHDLTVLLNLLRQTGAVIPAAIAKASTLTVFAVAARYPGMTVPTRAEYRMAIRLANDVVRWAEAFLSSQQRARP